MLWWEVFVLVCVVTKAANAQLSADWVQYESFLKLYDKKYVNDSTESTRRFEIFQESLRRHHHLNSYELHHNGAAKYGVTKFSDLTVDEFKSLYLSPARTPVRGKAVTSCDYKQGSVKNPPSQYDWRDKNVVTPVKNQGQCGSCWALAVVETIESSWSIQSQTLLPLSSQQVISCDYSPNQSLDGCDGGSLSSAFATLQSRQNISAIVPESVYPFVSGDGQTYPCRKDVPPAGVQLVQYNYCQPLENETNMQALLYTYSPLTVSVNAVSWQDYIGGIIQHHCTNAAIDHAVQLVGYDLTGPLGYWIVRNTWGTDWGEDGYLRLLFGANTCGVDRRGSQLCDQNTIFFLD
ncbi:hypothetical protein EMCRGX_G033598 [Ephydatia muelleri]